VKSPNSFVATTLYTNLVLTVIALCLVLLVWNQQLPTVQAQRPQEVIVVANQVPALPVALVGTGVDYRGRPVWAGPLPVGLREITRPQHGLNWDALRVSGQNPPNK
jgi:hypothetical protein